MQGEVRALSARNAVLAHRIAGTEKSLLQTEAGVAPLVAKDSSYYDEVTRESSIWNGGMKARDPSPDPAAQSPARR
jgi:hypothetical protein